VRRASLSNLDQRWRVHRIPRDDSLSGRQSGEFSKDIFADGLDGLVVMSRASPVPPATTEQPIEEWLFRRAMRSLFE